MVDSSNDNSTNVIHTYHYLIIISDDTVCIRNSEINIKDNTNTNGMP